MKNIYFRRFNLRLLKREVIEFMTRKVMKNYAEWAGSKTHCSIDLVPYNGNSISSTLVVYKSRQRTGTVTSLLSP